MKCPQCGSPSLSQDNNWEACNHCSYTNGGSYVAINPGKREAQEAYARRVKEANRV